MPLDNMGSPVSQTKNEGTKQSTSRVIWNRWLKVAEVIGTVQMVVIMTIVYWIMIPFMAIPLKLFTDPLSLRRGKGPSWTIREEYDEEIIDQMKNQF